MIASSERLLKTGVALFEATFRRGEHIKKEKRKKEKTMSKTLKRAVSLLLASCMICALFASVTVFAEPEQKTLTYVALGDSMTQGYMFTDYNENADEGHYCGWQGLSERSYIKKFAAYLADNFVGDVELCDLTVQGLLPDIVYAFLKPETFDFESMNMTSQKLIGWWTGEYHTDLEQSPDENGEGRYHIFDTFADMSNYYIDAIKKADVITYDIGENYFGTFLSGLHGENEVFTNLLSDTAVTRLAELLRVELSTYLKTNGLNAFSDRLDTTMYAYVSYIVYTEKCLEAIYEINPDVEVIIVPLSNPHQEIYLDVNGRQISYSDIINFMMESLNEYMRNTCEYRDRYTIAELSEPVMSFADELYFHTGDELSEDATILLERTVLGNDSILGSQPFAVPEQMKDYIDANNDMFLAMTGGLMNLYDWFIAEYKDEETGDYIITQSVFQQLVYEFIADKYGSDVAFKDFFGENYFDFMMTFMSYGLPGDSLFQENCLSGDFGSYTLHISNINNARAAIEAGTAAEWQKHIVEAVDSLTGNWIETCVKAATYRVLPSDYAIGGGPSITYTSDNIVRILTQPETITDEEYIALHIAIRNGEGARGFGSHPCPAGMETKYNAVLGAYKSIRDGIDGAMNEVTVHYVYENGTEALPDASAKAVIGEKYRIETPAIENYAPDLATVCDVMTGADYEIYVTFRPITGVCHIMQDVSLSAGKHNLYVNGTDMGSFSFAKSGAGWTIADGNNNYLSISGSSLNRSRNNPFVWTYRNGCFSASVRTTVLFIFSRTTTYYLVAGYDGLDISTSSANANTKFADVVGETVHVVSEPVIRNEHPADCKNEGYYDEVFICDNCGRELACTQHITDVVDVHTAGEAQVEIIDGERRLVTRCTVCDEILFDEDAPENAGEITAKVNVQMTQTRLRFFFRTTSYHVDIETECTLSDVRIVRVQYSTNGRTWITGNAYTTSTKPGTVYVRVTDSTGKITSFVYKNGKTQKS